MAALPGLPELDPPAQVAARLLLLIHYGIDWQQSWIATRRHDYWPTILPDRILAATYRAPNLRTWWTTLHHQLDTAPRTPSERAELNELLAADSHPVLRVLRTETDALVLYVRVVTEAVREVKTSQREEGTPQ